MGYAYGRETQQYTKDAQGLTEAEVLISRQKYGENRVSKKKRKGFLLSLLESFGDPMIKVLLIALAINIVFLSQNANWFESAGIALAILLATLVSTISEYGSESAFEKLQEEAARIRCRVQRADGLKELPIEEIVVGDLILLQAGDRIPADGHMIQGQIEVDQSILNGESKEVKKFPSPLADNLAAKDGFLSPGGVFSGSIVCTGAGMMQVSLVGDQTFYGRIGVEIQEETRESPLRYRLKSLASGIGKFGYIAAIISALVFLFNNILINNSFNPTLVRETITSWEAIFPLLIQACTLGVTVVVMAVPEGLPMMITVVLSANMKRMLKDNVLVRKLIGIETAGSLNILFTDKTGTLTSGRLEVVQLISGAGRVYAREKLMQEQMPLSGILKDALYYNSAASIRKHKAIGGNATDRATLEFASGLPGGRAYLHGAIVLPFTSDSKMMVSIVSGGWNAALVKGAPEKILPLCTQYYDETGRINLFADHERIEDILRQYAKKSMRFIAVAIAEPRETTLRNMKLVGLLGIRDEIRPEAVEAIAQVQSAGIQTVMITGDARATAMAIAREAGLIHGEEDLVITSDEMQALTDEKLVELLPRIRVVARAYPSDKSRLVRIAQEMGLVVGMTGDGVNDAPALKKADVGFAMGSGTEVAKEAGDIVILDDNFSSIAKAICYGRTIFKSIRKFIIYQVSICLCAVGITVIGPLINVDFPITVIQMLWINVVMDTLAGLAFSGEQSREDYMLEPPKRRDEPIVNRYMLSQIAVTSIYTVVLCLDFLKGSFFNRMSAVYGQTYGMTAFFALFMFCAIFISFNARTHRLNLLKSLASNVSFLWIMGVVTVVQVLILYLGGQLFRTVPMSPDDLLTIALIAFTVIPVDFIRKSLSRNSTGT